MCFFHCEAHLSAACFQVVEGVNDTANNFLAAIERDEAELAPSSLYAAACVQEGIPFINGSPQNTFVPGLIDLAVQKGVLIAGDDFKSGQTKLKSVLVDFLVGAGIKPTSIVSYNHLGNNDGMNLSAPQTFRSKVSHQPSAWGTAVLGQLKDTCIYPLAATCGTCLCICKHIAAVQALLQWPPSCPLHLLPSDCIPCAQATQMWPV